MKAAKRLKEGVLTAGRAEVGETVLEGIFTLRMEVRREPERKSSPFSVLRFQANSSAGADMKFLASPYEVDQT